MATSQTITLATPFKWGQKTVTEVELKEPTGGLFSQLGEPRILVHSASGGGYYIEQPDVIRKYLEKCIVVPQLGSDSKTLGADTLSFLSLEDAREVSQVLTSFFEAADARRLARKLTASSSERDA